jgi:tripartite-type tricarboxylate transporter receptor subunit TctC
MFRRLAALCLAPLCLAVSFLPQGVTSAQAQEYPTKAIRIIVTTSPGGISDVFIRAVAEPLHQRLGQPVIIENRAGGNMIIGARACAEAAPDGYTLCVMPGEPLLYNQFQFKNIPYDPDKSFQPITNLIFLTQALGVATGMNVKTLDELAAYSKAKPGTLSYSAPSSSLIHFMEKWKRETGADLVKVPFKGGGDTVNGILSGSTPVGFLGLGNFLAYIRAGTITPVLVDSEKRSTLVPEVSTLGEIGFSRDHTRAFFGLLAPAGTPRPIVDRVREEVGRIVNEPAFLNRHLIERGLESAINTPEEFQQFMRDDRLRAERIVKAAEAGAQ